MVPYWCCWEPREVAKVARVKTKKQLIKNFEIGNFGATKTLYTSKESREESLFRFEIKLETFVLNFFFNLLKFSRLLKKRLFFLFCKLSHFLWKLIGYPILSIALRNRAGYIFVVLTKMSTISSLFGKRPILVFEIKVT